VDIDEFLGSPKLRLKLSPAELDKTLLELHDKISESPGGDVLRVMGGGGIIGLQNLYMKRKAAKENRKKLSYGLSLDLFPNFAEDFVGDEDRRTATQWIRWTLNRNLPRRGHDMTAAGNATVATGTMSATTGSSGKRWKQNNKPMMCIGAELPFCSRLTSWIGFRPTQAWHRPKTFSLLI
jgi:hypothetical protein